ncbi:hypothetical protein ACJX0J_013654, partial [Zea mays]
MDANLTRELKASSPHIEQVAKKLLGIDLMHIEDQVIDNIISRNLLLEVTWFGLDKGRKISFIYFVMMLKPIFMFKLVRNGVKVLLTPGKIEERHHVLIQGMVQTTFVLLLNVNKCSIGYILTRGNEGRALDIVLILNVVLIIYLFAICYSLEMILTALIYLLRQRYPIQ